MDAFTRQADGTAGGRSRGSAPLPGPLSRLCAVVGLIGEAGSGKTTLARALTAGAGAGAIAGAQAVSVSEVLKALHRVSPAISSTPGDSGVPVRADLAAFGERLVATGVAALCREVLAKCEPSTSVLIVDGVRHSTFATELGRQAQVPTFLVWLSPPKSVRISRLMSRGMSDVEIAELARHPTEATIAKWAPGFADLILGADDDVAGTNRVRDLVGHIG